MISNSKRISLWLLPPEPLATTLSSIQSDIIANHPKDRQRHLPRFIPHVTLIGGIPISECCTAEEIASQHHEHEQHDEREQQHEHEHGDIDIDEEAAQIVLRRLQLAFQSNKGGVTCNFVKERGVFAARSPPDDGVGGEDIVKWNQSCVSILERNSSLMKAMQVADDALFTTTTTSGNNNNELSVERYFKPPLCEPHYSFVYGNDADLIPTSLECPPSFTSTEMVVIWTYPSDLESVESWREIGRVCMGREDQRSMI